MRILDPDDRTDAGLILQAARQLGVTHEDREDMAVSIVELIRSGHLVLTLEDGQVVLNDVDGPGTRIPVVEGPWVTPPHP